MTTITSAPAGRTVTAPTRVASVDILRGVVMVLMAIDHVRVYSGVPAGGPTAGVFLTRWVTHFCAPLFVFYAGTSAFLYGQKLMSAPGLKAGPALAGYLASRGLLLILLEFTVIRASWTFHLDYSSFLLAGVIWMLGCCMILMAALVWLPTRVIGALGVGIILLQQVFGPLGGALPAPLQPLWEFIYPVGAEVTIGGASVAVLYTLVPWIGVMAAGYGFGTILVREPQERDRLCLRIGLGATVIFILAAVAGALSQPTGEDGPPVWMRILNQQKYPASQLFLLMTLGPAIAVVPWAERAGGALGRLLTTFGRVPMFYYLLHIPLIHAVSLIVWKLRDGRFGDERFATAPYVFIPPGGRWSLWLLYLVVGIVVALLYPACRWYASVKARGPHPILRYL